MINKIACCALLIFAPLNALAATSADSSTADRYLFAKRNQAAMAKMEKNMHHAPMNGDPDHDFVTMMIPHHQGAIDMAKAYLESGGTDPTLKPLAENIIKNQDEQIKLMEQWLNAYGKKAVE